MKLRTKLKVKLWLLRAALAVSIVSALIWTVPILHGDYTAGLTGIALSYIIAILAAGFSFATKWDLENIELLIDEEVKLITGEFFNALIDKKIDDDLAKHTSSFERVIDRQRRKILAQLSKRKPYWKTLEQMDREHLARLIDKGAMPPAHPHPIKWASTDGKEIKVNPRKLQDYLEG